MFESISSSLQKVFQRLAGTRRLTEDNIQEAMREVRMALLEADVNFKVVKEFVATVTEKAVGQEVLSSLSPGQQVVKVVHDELVLDLFAFLESPFERHGAVDGDVPAARSTAAAAVRDEPGEHERCESGNGDSPRPHPRASF